MIDSPRIVSLLPSTTTDGAAIAAAAPAVIVFIPCGYYKEEVLRALAEATLPDGWDDLPAVRAGEVWAVDASAYFSRPGPRVVDGAEILAHIFHPEIFGPPSNAQALRVPPELMWTESRAKAASWCAGRTTAYTSTGRLSTPQAEPIT